MCGIAGVVAWDEKYRVKREQLQRMADALAHRGPDGEGFYLNFEDREITPDNPQCGFAFRRLAIIDPDPRSNQPFTIGHQTLVFNGEIYNYRELRSEISKLRPDYPWRTTGDTEVLLMSYAVWGEKCVEHLNGMFAFAVWDEARKELFLARDRMGQKPVFVARVDGGIAFASEVAALRPIDWMDRTLSELGLVQYLSYGYAEQFNSTINQVPPGFTERHRAGVDVWSSRGYFQEEMLSAPDLDRSTAVRSLVMQAVTRQLVSDVPLGVFLSGGADSSVIAYAARRQGPVQTFSIAFDDPPYDESHHAAKIASFLGTEHHIFNVRPHAAEDLPKLVPVFGQPFADSSALPTHYLAQQTRQHVKVALSGDGGDELFGGYDRYRAIHLSQRVARLVPHLAAAGAERLAGGHPKSGLTRAARFVRSLSLPIAQRYASFLRIFDNALIKELMPGVDLWKDLIAEMFENRLHAGAQPAEAACAVDRVTYLPDDLLTKVDRASMLHGLEVRSPFMDHELVQFAAGLSTDQLLKGGPKRMLREAFAKDLPDFVFKRPKMGFAVPIGEWFRGELRPMLRENLFASDSFGRQHFNMQVVERLVEEHETERVDHSQRLYALLMLELWWRWHRSH